MNTDEASKKIAAILLELEKSTGCTVSDISIDNIDVTSLGDKCRQIYKKINIKIERPYGAMWDI